MSVDQKKIEKIKNAIDHYKSGGFLVVSDNEDRENEGDLIIASEFATPQAINFMITHGKGLVCVAITQELAQKKNLDNMVINNSDPHGTAFTVSIDASPDHGVSTGISAGDRSKTIEVLLDENDTNPDSLRTPGHMFPLIAKPGGLAVRQGHTEAAVDLSRMAGLKPSGVIVEIIKQDGTMARRNDLVEFCYHFDIPFITIEDLCVYYHHVHNEEMSA